MADVDGSGRPLLRVVRGTPDASELAALTVVLTAMLSATPEPAPRPRPAWASHERALASSSLRTCAGPGGWRASTLPR